MRTLLLVFSSLLFFPSLTFAYVGSDQCIECHASEHEQWQGSHHDMAMRHTDDEAVLGDFDDVSFEFEGKTNRFYRQGDEYWVNIEGPDGKFHDYQIEYTFGWMPLQQYMTEFDDGRVQLIPFAWDSRPAAQGGQTWFHLYPEFTKNTDDFYWTNAGQNWNFMCADCHSTNLEKNYDLETNTYASSWSEINVACEACHGPAEDHMTWAQTNDKRSSTTDHAGFRLNLAPQVETWVYQEGSSTLVAESISPTQQTSMCAQCHSRRLQLTEDNPHVAKTYSDRYLLDLVSEELYHFDGQIYDENYVYGSFLQSKMASSGVVCTDCHNPHTAELKLPEEVLCNQCHLPDGFGDEMHSRHEPGSEAAQCTSCHMPETTYMQVDPRRDHSWQVPRPDLSQQLGTPNVCVDCHNNTPEEGNQWAIDTLKQWFPNSSIQGSEHFAQAFAKGAFGSSDAASALSYQAQDINNASIIRASAIERLANYPSNNAVVALSRAQRSEYELMRLAIVNGSANYQPADRWRILSPLLSDPVLAVRIETAGMLVQDWQALSNEQRELLQPALDEYVASAQFNADRAFGRVNMGNVHLFKGQLAQAQQAYEDAIIVEPYAAVSYINMADLYRAQGNNQASSEVLKKAIDLSIEDANLDFAYAMSLVRIKEYQAALRALKSATRRDPINAQYWYTLGILSQQLGVNDAIQALQKAYEISPQPQYLYPICEAMINGQSPQAKACIDQFEQIGPADATQQLRTRLNAN